MTTLTAAFAAGRATREQRTRRKRQPILLTIGGFLGRRMPTWQATRTAVLSVSGFACLDYAAYQVNAIAGYAAIGVTLLVLEALGGDRR